MKLLHIILLEDAIQSITYSVRHKNVHWRQCKRLDRDGTCGGRAHRRDCIHGRGRRGREGGGGESSDVGRIKEVSGAT